MDKKQEIINLQNEIIRSMTEKNLRSIGDDLWGVRPTTPKIAASDTRDVPTLFNTPAPKAPAIPLPDAQGLLDAAEKNRLELERLTNELLGNGKGTGALPEVPLSPLPTQKSTPAAQKAEREEAPTPPENIEDLKKELAEYIGLNTVKDEVNSLINWVAIMKKRRDAGLPTPDLSLHMVFSGNPGTGKTMIARLMARIYKSLGILSKGQLVETDRSGLVAGYVGQTALKTQEIINKAKGGVLFIDEAYTLTSRGANDYGQEAVDTLLKAMEDNRDDLIVIVAGYIELMEEFVNSNPGLKSRFNRFMAFPDYTVEEMLGIFDMRCKKSGYRLEDDAAREALKKRVEEGSRDVKGFGNARGVRNLFEKALSAQADRLAHTEALTRDALMNLTAQDIKNA